MVLGEKRSVSGNCKCGAAREVVICGECRNSFCDRCQAMEVFQKHDGNTIRIKCCPRCLGTDIVRPRQE